MSSNKSYSDTVVSSGDLLIWVVNSEKQIFCFEIVLINHIRENECVLEFLSGNGKYLHVNYHAADYSYESIEYVEISLHSNNVLKQITLTQ